MSPTTILAAARSVFANQFSVRVARMRCPAPSAAVGDDDLGEVVAAYTAACVDEAMQLLRLDPATAADDAQVVRLAVRLGRAYLVGVYGTAAGPADLDRVLAWAGWAVAASERLYGPGSTAALDAARILVRLLRRGRRVAEAADLQRGIAASTLARAGFRIAGSDLLAYADLLQDARQCAEAADQLDRYARRWQRQWRTRRADRLHVAMSLAVRHAVCGRADTARHHLAAATPYRPRNRDRDYVEVQVYYGVLFADRRRAHRTDCTWPTPDHNFDFNTAMRR
ncbi:hypothetical protein [Dactylosporangium salmoneum]|uniref:Transcriptional regulator n=1 Tax=Dactylosporangium salmoneum TaxID=53361 RepID=A0ABP5U7B2_9ACTN